MSTGWLSHYCLSCCILTVGSRDRLSSICQQLVHIAACCIEREAIFQETLFSVLHLCPAVPKAGSVLGLTVSTNHIFQIHCKVDVARVKKPFLYLTQSSSAPLHTFYLHTYFHTKRMSQEAVHVTTSCSTWHAGP